jgi:pimeloyl-ACP methyl ester carboxylesterase
VSGVISIPKDTPPAGGWPILSWAHGTTGNAPQCAPSRSAKPNVEQRFLNDWVAAGYAVAQTDYEGEGTPGLHPYFASVAGAHDTIDIVRAARALDPRVGNRWIVMGHSEGGTVTLFTASLAASWAPELRLLGAVSYAPASDITDLLGHVVSSPQPTTSLPLAMMMVEGIASTDPSVDLNRILSPRGLTLLPQLQAVCVGALMNSPAWNAIPPDSLFQANAPIDRLAHDFWRNEPLNLSIPVPLRIEQGQEDQLVSPDMTGAVQANLCANGVHAELDAVAGADHDSIMARTFNAVKAWVAQRFAGAATPPITNCPNPPSS